MKQVLFLDLEQKTLQTGFLLDDGRLICGCCGGIYEKEEEGTAFTIVKASEEWQDIQSAILENKDLYECYIAMKAGY